MKSKGRVRVPKGDVFSENFQGAGGRGGHFQSKKCVAHFGIFLRFFSMSLTQKSHFRVQGMLFQQLYWEKSKQGLLWRGHLNPPPSPLWKRSENSSVCFGDAICPSLPFVTLHFSPARPQSPYWSWRWQGIIWRWSWYYKSSVALTQCDHRIIGWNLPGKNWIVS